jgi:hypothetical protein
MSKRILLTALFCGLAALVSQPVPAKAASPALTGSWQFTLTPLGPTPTVPIPGLATFTSDGSMTETDGLELISGPSSTTGKLSGSPGHGIWQLGPPMTYFYVQYDSLVVNPNGSLNATNKTTMNVSLTSTGMTFSGSYMTQTISPQGTVLKTVTGAVTGQLIPHPPLP